ncbi:phage integrase SAM-like domain-containing protein [Aliarcobacter butzleri]|uniref:phage integrase SAM-like domain-containing protein n=1 Tax=Aliarcobacter butzleri TaxID=28197 RepID=UPI00263D1A01|nr:phage integrase SAM-like domain-containing protein [Aliarcobacter butzleri]MDN5049329.1 phage integrase SAM-like domain-containing protein [Aliarcobacter butzleri]MDN5056476.1 phage integrase SAM-like domain-containing protein [Aliarcobacter butzleri]
MIKNLTKNENIKINYSFEKYYRKYTKSIEQKVFALEKIAEERNYNKHIKNVFGDLAIDKITSQDITHWQNNLKENEKLAKSSILRIRSCLNVMFEDAIENNLIQKNPIQKAKKLGETENSKVPRVKLTPFKKSEILTIL